MNQPPAQFLQMLAAVQRGEASPLDAWQQIREFTGGSQPLTPEVMRTGDAVVDIDRAQRCGFPEVIYAPGKTAESISEIVSALKQQHQPVLATRVDDVQAEFACKAHADLQWNPIARTLRSTDSATPQTTAFAHVPVLAAGTTDRPIAEEASETLRWAGCSADVVLDIGVAGPQRLQQVLPELRSAPVVIVAAGMEGALPSVVGGYLACPVIAVPTSVGYGTGQGGFAALLGMLNSCAANVTVVNIDAGFKAGYVAALMCRQMAQSRHG